MKKSIKRIIAVCLAVMLIASAFAGCSKAGGSKKYTVGICQLVQHEALDAATKGFKEALTEKLGADNVEFVEQNAGGDSATCSTITNGFVSQGVDLIFANATPALQAAMQSTNTIPIVGTSITDYATALDIDQSSWTGKTGINVTGSSDLAPLADQAAMFKEICPDAKTIGILYCSAEANSKYQADVVSSELTKLGYTVKVYTVADTNEIASVTTTACSEVDAIYVPTDNTLASATSAVNEIAEPAGIPIIAGEEGICKGCGVATLSISYENLGQVAGEMAADILQNGTNPADMEIKTATNLTKKYVADRAQKLGLTVPSDYVAIDA